MKIAAKNMTSGSPLKLMLAFSIPILIGNIFQQVYNLVDSIVVGKFVGPKALASVGVTGSVSFFVFALAIGITNGIAVLIAQYFGADDKKAVKEGFATSMFAMLGIMVVLTVMGLLLAKPILLLLKTPPDILEDAHLYLMIIFAGSLGMGFYNWIACVLRALGDSFTPLIFLIISSILNIVLDLLFVVTFQMGVAGAAVATILAQFLSAIMCFSYALVKMPFLRLRREDLKVNKDMLVTCFRIGLPAGIQSALISVSAMIMQSVINVYGSVIVAGYAAALKVEQLAFQPGFSLGMASATFTGQNIGAGNYKRVEKGFHASILLIIIFYSVISPLLWFFSENIMSMFVNQSEISVQVVEAGSQYLKIIAFFLIPVGVLMVEQQMLRSAGDVAMTMVLGLSEVITRIGISFLFSGFFGYLGVFWATPVTWLVAWFVGYLRYLSGAWKQKGLIQ